MDYKIKIYPRVVYEKYILQIMNDDFQEINNDKGHWLQTNSPFYDDRKHRLGINCDTGLVYDLKESQGYSFTNFVAKHLDKDYTEAKIFIAQFCNGFADKFDIKPRFMQQSSVEDAEVVELPELKMVPPVKYFTKENIASDPLGAKAYKYLTVDRHLTDEHLTKYRLGYISEKLCYACYGEGEINDEQCPICKGKKRNKFYGRIFIPAYEDGKLVYFQGRDFIHADSTMRYLNPSAPRDQVVYNIDLIPEGADIFLLEGPVDAMTLNNYDTSATMSSRISIPQIKKLLQKNPKSFTFVFDYDKDLRTRKIVFANYVKSYQTLTKLCEGEIDDVTIPIRFWRWFDLSDKKDINASNITVIDPHDIKEIHDAGQLEKYFERYLRE